MPTALTSATCDNANQIATFGGTTLTYDATGNLTSDGARTYTWNARNQLASLTGPVNASFAYDGLARRRSKTVASTTTQFLYDGLNPVQELAGGSPTANLLTGLGIDEFFTRTDSVGARYYLTDAVGSMVGLSDGAGVVQTEYTYEPFGSTTWSGSSTSNSFVFTGREADGTGLLYYRARYYDSRLQRFIAEDPLGFGAGDSNLHAYVGNSPQNLIDPTGTIPAPLVLPLAGCLGGAAGGLLGPMLNGRKPDLLDLVGGCLMGIPFGLPRLWPFGPGLGPLLPGLPRVWPGSGPPSTPPVPGLRPGPSDATVDAFRRQLQEHGRRALERSLRTIEANIADHLRRLEAARQAGGPTSSLERELRTFQSQVDAIRQLLGGG